MSDTRHPPVMDETFFTAQRRHRRTARRYGLLAGVAALIHGIPAAVLVVPAMVGVAVLVTDVVNLVVPVADLGPPIGRAVDAALNGDGAPSWAFALAALGLLGMVLLWWAVRRFMLRDGLGGVLVAAGARPPDRDDDEEHQLVNVVEEIAIAAGIRPPRVLVLPADVPNAAAFGRTHDDATIAVSRGLLTDLDRDATQGVVAHLVGSVGNGDLRMQHSLLSLFVAYQLAQDLIAWPFASACRRRVRAARRMLRGKAGPEDEASTIKSLLAWDDSTNFVVNVNGLGFRITQVYLNLFVVGGILTLPFRARRYLADATAVELTRTPDGLGRALVHLAGTRRNLPGAGYAAIYAITAADEKGNDKVEDAMILPASLHPPLRRRIGRLRSLGFTGALPGDGSGDRRRGPAKVLVQAVGYAILVAVGVPFGIVVALLVTVGIGLALACGFGLWTAVTAVVVVPLHHLLRALA